VKKYFLIAILNIARIIGILIETIGVYLAISLIFSLIITPYHSSKNKDISIYLRSNGIHLDLVLPVKSETVNWSLKIPYKDTPAADSTDQFIAFGWGEKAFFLQTPTWKDFKLSTMLKSLFFMGTSAMHTSYYKNMYETEKCIRLDISLKEYQQLVQFIQNEFQQDELGNYLLIEQKSYGKYDAFYEAKSPYNVFYTCNSWVNSALKAAYQKACLWTPFSYVLLNSYRSESSKTIE
jgi:uncharacterized protein (TIGR02117 family)